MNNQRNLATKITLTVATSLALTVAGAGRSEAILAYEFIQQGSDVGLTVSGSLSGLPAGLPSNTTGPSIIGPSLAIIASGNLSGTNYFISGPANFGTGGPNLMSYSGDPFSFGFGNSLILSNTYAQGSAISGSGLFTGKTLADLGLSATSGLLGTWTIGSDTIEVWAGAKPAASPTPLSLLGATAAFAYSRRLRARVRQGSSTPLG